MAVAALAPSQAPATLPTVILSASRQRRKP